MSTSRAKSVLVGGKPQQCNAAGARQGKLWHPKGVEYVAEDVFRSWTAYRDWNFTTLTQLARRDMKLRAQDARADSVGACQHASVTREVARRPVPPLHPYDTLAPHWQKRKRFLAGPRPLPLVREECDHPCGKNTDDRDEAKPFVNAFRGLVIRAPNRTLTTSAASTTRKPDHVKNSSKWWRRKAAAGGWPG